MSMAFGWTMLGKRRTSGVTWGVAATLAPGIAASTVMAALAITMFWSPLQDTPTRGLANIWLTNPQVPGFSLGLPDAIAQRLADSAIFSSAVRINVEQAVWTVAGQPQQLGTATISPGFFDLTGAALAAGSVGSGGATGYSAVVGWRLATGRWGSTGAALGQRIALGG